MNNLPFKSIGIVGLGLIGGSLSKAFNSKGIAIYGYDIDRDTIKECGISGVFESVTDEIDVFLSYPMELIYISLPVKATHTFIDLLGKKNIKIPVTDSASTKLSIIDSAKKANLNFCGGHPIKGKETSGFRNSEKDLFINARHLLTPVDDDNLALKLKTLHQLIGMNVSFMEALDHDKIFAIVSHFPHFAAFCLMDMVGQDCSNALEYIGGGFRDFTRIAASDPIMWADIFKDNKTSLLESIDHFSDTIKKWRDFVDSGSYENLRENILKVSDLRRTL